MPGRPQADRQGRPDPAVPRPLGPFRRRRQRRARDRRAGRHDQRVASLAGAARACRTSRAELRRHGRGRRARGHARARRAHEQRRRERRQRVPGRAGRLRRASWRTGQRIYFAGDTALFGDMRLIGELYAPEIAFLPIGDYYTMGPDAAARACHDARRPPGRADALRHHSRYPHTVEPERLRPSCVEPQLRGIDVLECSKPGETAELRRNRTSGERQAGSRSYLTRIAFQGATGAYSESAARRAWPRGETVALDRFEDVFDAVKAGDGDPRHPARSRTRSAAAFIATTICCSNTTCRSSGRRS